jgi:hypothetical protein
VLLEFTVRMLSTYLGGNIDSLYPKYDSEAIRFFCNGTRLIVIIFSALAFIPTKYKGIGFLFGFVYFIGSLFFPSEIYLGEFTIIIYKGFTSFIGGVFGILVAGFIIKYENEFYNYRYK